MIRFATDTDFPDILDIWQNNILEKYTALEFISDSYLETFQKLFKSRKNHINFWVAIDQEDQIIGWQAFQPVFHSPLKSG